MANRDVDRKVLEVMLSHGADLSKLAHTIHYLYFPTRESALAAAGELLQYGYERAEVSPAAEPSLWKRLTRPARFCCVVETHAVPNEHDVFATTEKMNALVARHGGEYDGWEASVER